MLGPSIVRGIPIPPLNLFRLRRNHLKIKWESKWWVGYPLLSVTTISATTQYAEPLTHGNRPVHSSGRATSTPTVFIEWISCAFPVTSIYKMVERLNISNKLVYWRWSFLRATSLVECVESITSSQPPSVWWAVFVHNFVPLARV